VSFLEVNGSCRVAGNATQYSVGGALTKHTAEQEHLANPRPFNRDTTASVVSRCPSINAFTLIVRISRSAPLLPAANRIS
jgi:hypothetical protein